MNAHRWKPHNDFPDDTEADTFAYEVGYHNGPKCVVCGFYFCHHCNPDGWNTECGTAPIPGQDSYLGQGAAMTTTVAVTFQFRTNAIQNEAALRRRLIRDLTEFVEQRYAGKLDQGHSFIGINQIEKS